MNRKNRYYPPEFKQEALELLASGEYSMAQLERELGIIAGTLRQWKQNEGSQLLKAKILHFVYNDRLSNYNEV
jgi:transposase-like protein